MFGVWWLDTELTKGCKCLPAQLQNFWASKHVQPLGTDGTAGVTSSQYLCCQA
jgi:hypothetical protein